MKVATEFLLNFLVNAVWQVALIAVFAEIADRLPRRSTSLRYIVWVAALMLCLILPLYSAITSSRAGSVPKGSPQDAAVLRAAPLDNVGSQTLRSTASSASPLRLSATITVGTLSVYLMLLTVGGLKLGRAGLRTRTIRQNATAFEPAASLRAIIENCQRVFGIIRVKFLCSETLRTPATIGVFRALVVLPQALLHSGEEDALTAAIGHELVHVVRRDYLLNLIYELVFLPVSFHPGARLIRRRIRQTRELCCDELVAKHLLHPEVYARSLVQLAGSAMPLKPLRQTVMVGIADADILEVRIMSLLKQNRSNFRRPLLGILLAVLLLTIPCVAATAFALHLKVESTFAVPGGQEPSVQTQERKEKREQEEREVKERQERETALEKQIQEIRQRIETETNSAVKADLEKKLRRQEEELSAINKEGDVVLTVRRNLEGELREREIEQQQKAELARVAKISMDQAIQIATGQRPGKVLECSLVGEHWEAPGKLGKDGLALYHVIILSGDEANPVTYHVLVNAVDGSIFRTEKQEPRTEGRAYPRTERLPN